MLLPGVYSTSSGCVPAASLGAVPSQEAVASRSFEKQIFFEAFFPLLCFVRPMDEGKKVNRVRFRLSTSRLGRLRDQTAMMRAVVLQKCACGKVQSRNCHNKIKVTQIS